MRQAYSPDVNHCVLSVVDPKVMGRLNKIGSLIPAECLVGFESGIFQSIPNNFQLPNRNLPNNILTYSGTLPKKP